MKAMQCELCGGTEIVKDGDLFVCQSCGMKYTLESARRMMIEGAVEVKGTVKQDRSDELTRLLELAQGGIDAGNYAGAESYAMRALEIDLNNARAWVIKAEAIDWQMTQADDRYAESSQARLEMYKILRKTSSKLSYILDIAQLIASHRNHVDKISATEIIFFTNPMKNNPGKQSLTLVNTLVDHIGFRKTELASLQTLARLWNMQAKDLKAQDCDLTPEQIGLLDKTIELLGTLDKTTPSKIDTLNFIAASKLIEVAIKGSGEANKSLANSINKSVKAKHVYGLDSEIVKKIELDGFDAFTYACDACIATAVEGAKLLLSESLSDNIDEATIEEALFLCYENICLIEKENLEHSIGGYTLTNEAKALRRKDLTNYEKLRDSYDPEIKKQKHENDIQKRMSELFSDAWDKDPRKAVVDQLVSEKESARNQLADLKDQLSSLSFFKRKEKAELESKIAELETRVKQIESNIESERDSFWTERHSIAASQIDNGVELPAL